ncbi:MAG: chromosomal replication initiator protein DnaA [Elusimicrobiota bacterium]
MDKLKPTKEHDAKELWTAVVDNIRSAVGEQNIDLWFAPVLAVDVQDKRLRVRVPNKFFSAHIKENYQKRIEAVLKELTGSDLALDYTISKDLKNVLPKADPIEEARPQSEFTLSELNPRYMFNTFVVGTSNRFAHATAEAVAKAPGRQFNPFFIYGGVGLGKTHLMHAIGHAMRKHNARSRVLYTTSEEFVNEYIDSLRYDKPEAFRNKYRHLDCLLIDDIQFLIGKGRSEEEFFYTFNALFDSRKQIVIASDRAPKEMAPAEKRLISRLEWGVVSDIRAPDLETRIAILRKKAESEKIFIPDDVILFIATAIKSNIRELEGALIRLSAFSSLTGNPLDVDAARELLKDSIGTEPASAVRVETIQSAVCEKYSLQIKELKGRSRTSEIAFPRQLAMYLACQLTDLSTTEIGRVFGGRDHTTVIHGRDKIKKKLAADPFFVELVNKLIERIHSVENQ